MILQALKMLLTTAICNICGTYLSLGTRRGKKITWYNFISKLSVVYINNGMEINLHIIDKSNIHYLFNLYQKFVHVKTSVIISVEKIRLIYQHFQPNSANLENVICIYFFSEK